MTRDQVTLALEILESAAARPNVDHSGSAEFRAAVKEIIAAIKGEHNDESFAHQK